MKRSRLVWRLVIAALVILGFATGACEIKIRRSDAAHLDSASAARFIAGWLAEKHGIATTVTCPDDRPVKAEDTFICKATTGDGEVLVIDTTQKDDQGNLTFKLRGLLVDTRTDLDSLQAKLPASAVIACPRRVLYLKHVGDTASCDVHDGDEHARLVIRYEDAEAGRFNMEVVAAAT